MPSKSTTESTAPVHRDVLCRDGGVVRVRALTTDDGDAMVRFYRQLDEVSLYRRFMTHTLPRDEVLLSPINTGDPLDEVLGVEVAGDLVAVGLAVKMLDDDVSEVAFAVRKDHQGRGIGTILLEHLAATARDRGRTQFIANTLSSNLAMLDVFEQAGFRVTEENERGDVTVRLTLDDEANDAVALRDLRSHAASLRRFLHPSCVAVVGASRSEGTVGHALFRNLVTTGFTGTLYPVNLKAPSVLGVTAYPSIEALPTVPELVVIAVPSGAVRAVVGSCGKAGVAAVVIVTAGFAESTDDGLAAQQELVDLAHYYGMRIVGPNCVGIVNAAPEVQLNATFSPAHPTSGSIGFASQSGALGIAALDHLEELDLGISSFVSLGNKADVSGNDLLQYWANDRATSVAALYLESFGNPRKFARIARDFCMRKPIVAVKAGRTTSGRRAASSHTAALASSDFIAEALFRDAGITRVATLSELFDVTRLFATQPIPAGNRIAIVGNSGGPGILVADACEASGLAVPVLGPETQAALREALLPGAGVSNPVDVIAAASPQQYEDALRIVLDDNVVDAVIVIYTDPMVSEATEIAAAISRAAATSEKPIAANFLAADIGATITHPKADHPPIPVYEFPEPIAYAFAQAAELGAWRADQVGAKPSPVPIDLATALREVRAAAPPDGDRWAEPDQVETILSRWGIDLMSTATAASREEAIAEADALGYPVALKVVSDTITHKTDVGGVFLDLASSEDVAAAFDDMEMRLGADMSGVVVQPMASDGTELIIGGLSDAAFGPVVIFGAGGTAAEVWEDRAVALAPLTRKRAEALIQEPRISALLAGYRGAPAADRGALAEVLVRLGQLLASHPEILELDLNPVIATPAGVEIVDARCRIAAPAPRPQTPRRHLN